MSHRSCVLILCSRIKQDFPLETFTLHVQGTIALTRAKTARVYKGNHQTRFTDLIHLAEVMQGFL